MTDFYAGFLAGIIAAILPSMLVLAWLVWRESPEGPTPNAIEPKNPMNDLRSLHLIHSAIKYYQFFGVSPEIRDELLTVASRAIGNKPQTLSAAATDIEMKITKLKTGA
jgi:hypothetical protein